MTVTDAEVRTALSESIRTIVNAVRDALECVPPELCGDIYERGVVLTGGVAFLRKLDEHLQKETGLPVMKAEDPWIREYFSARAPLALSGAGAGTGAGT